MKFYFSLIHVYLFQGLLCGLCGNFNSISRDDMQTRRGLYATDADTLGSSWRVGGKRACSRAFEAPPTCAKTRRSKEKERLCKLLRSNIFGECRNHLNSLPYYK